MISPPGTNLSSSSPTTASITIRQSSLTPAPKPYKTPSPKPIVFVFLDFFWFSSYIPAAVSWCKVTSPSSVFFPSSLTTGR
jgi:hypothetical protein